MRLRRNVLAVLGSLVLVAGCGGEGGGDGGDRPTRDAASFEADYRQVSDRIEALGPDVAVAVETAAAKSNEELERAFDDLARRARAAGDGLAGLAPPVDLRDEVMGLRAAVAEGAADLERIARAARAGDARQATEATKALIAGSRALTRARRKLDEAVAERP